MHARLLLALVLALSAVVQARAGIVVLSTDKIAKIGGGKGSFHVGRDAALADGPAPTCPTASSLEVSSYPSAIQRVVVTTHVDLDCTRWLRKRRHFVYDDPAATGGVRRILYGRKGLDVRLEGSGFTAPTGPVGYLQVWLQVGDSRFNARFHNFQRNETSRLLTRRPSSDAAVGEAAFWAVLHGDFDSADAKDELETTALDSLRKASYEDQKDGHSRFLVAMMRLYRFSQMVERFGEATEFAKRELAVAQSWFKVALPLLWDGTKGDSRVAGFAAATTLGLGLVQNDPALQDEGMQELDAAYRANPFFNVFDYIPAVQALPAFDPRVQAILANWNTYVSDPETLACLSEQPEICNNRGYAPRNLAGTMMLFGDVAAKSGTALGPFDAAVWYGLALNEAQSQPTPYRFLSAAQLRVDTAAERVALFQDTDASNDPLVIGAGPEACVACHSR